MLKNMLNFFKKKPKIIVVLGQTATGKSDLAVEIAKKFDGEIISADSRQVYRGLDLGSGKITKKEMENIPHYLLDVANPQEKFDVAQFQKLGTQAITQILNHNKAPIICGGTGFYIDSLIYQTEFLSVQPNEKLRTELEKKSLLELQEILQKKSPGTFKKIDIKNPIRIIRALEIIEELGYLPKIKNKKKYKILFIGLTLPPEELKKNIYNRIIKRLKIEMIEEAEKLLQNKISHERLQSFGLEYRFMSKHLLGEISKQEMINKIATETWHFAKRQKTWFKRNKKIKWFNPKTENKEIFETVQKFLGK